MAVAQIIEVALQTERLYVALESGRPRNSSNPKTTRRMGCYTVRFASSDILTEDGSPLRSLITNPGIPVL